MFSPELNTALSNMNFLSPDANCHIFDHRANGYARGKGFGVLVLKPVSKAIKDGDATRALIRSVGVNQDGHTSGGIAQPSKDLKAKLIRIFIVMRVSIWAGRGFLRLTVSTTCRELVS